VLRLDARFFVIFAKVGPSYFEADELSSGSKRVYRSRFSHGMRKMGHPRGLVLGLGPVASSAQR
jgi:hypothetical protein